MKTVIQRYLLKIDEVHRLTTVLQNDLKSAPLLTDEAKKWFEDILIDAYIEGFVGKNGYVHKRHDAVCLETESCPDTPNQKNFPSCIVTPDKPYHEVTVYGFDF